jgi:ABC-2 type transport system permease protein
MSPFKNILNVWKYRELLRELVGREIKAKYKQSILGYAWVVLVPLVHLSVLTVVFSFLVRIQTGGIPYPVYLFVALVPWMFTSNSITAATASLLSNSQLITKIYLPREIFPLSSVIAKSLDLGLSVIILLIIMLIFGVKLQSSIIYLPVIFVVQLLLILGVSLILSAINVFYRDVENILGIFLMVWMYLTPIIYPPEIIPSNLTAIFNLNPMMGIINAYRNVLLHGVAPPLSSFLYSSVFSIVIFFVGFVYFRKRSRYFADVI